MRNLSRHTAPKRRFWKAEPNLSEIEHTFGQVGFGLPKSSFGEHRVTKADIARRVTTNRSESVGVCDHASCLVMFLAKSYKSRYRTTTNRSESIGVCDHASCLVMFLAKSYKSRYRTTTNRSESVGARPWHLGFCGYDHPFTKLDQICKPLILIGQTTVLEGGTKDAMRISNEALFKGVSTQLFGARTMEKCFLQNPHCIFCSAFPNLRLGSVTL